MDALAGEGGVQGQGVVAFEHLVRIMARAKESGDLRADFEPQDMAPLMWAMSQVIRESMDVAPDAWRRCPAFYLDGLRAEAAHPLPVRALSPTRSHGSSGEAARR